MNKYKVREIVALSVALAQAACATTAREESRIPFWVHEGGSCAVKENKEGRTYVCDVDGDGRVDAIENVIYLEGGPPIGNITFVLNGNGLINTMELSPFLINDPACFSGIYRVNLQDNEEPGCKLSDKLRIGFQDDVDRLVAYFQSAPKITKE